MVGQEFLRLYIMKQTIQHVRWSTVTSHVIRVKDFKVFETRRTYVSNIF